MPSDQLRLLIVSASFHPTIGGAETFVYEVARSLAAVGHAIAVVTDLPRGLLPGQPVPGDPLHVEVHRVSGYRALLADESKIPWEQMMFGLLPDLQRVLRRFSPNLVLSNSLDTAILAKMIELDQGIPWAATFHEQSPESEPMGTGRLRLVYEILRPTLILAGSEFYAARAREWGLGNQTVLIYHGVNTDLFRPDVDGSEYRRRHGIRPDEMVVVCAGRLKPRKGMWELIQAFKRFLSYRPTSRLLIVGTVNSASRDYANELRESAALIGDGHRVLFDESATLSSMPAVLAAADVIAQPSIEEGLGLSVIEAMASGRPVITTEIPGIREITTEPDVAFLVPPGDVDALADALAFLARDEHQRMKLAECGRRHVVRRFSHARMARETESALLGLLASCVGSRL